MAEILPLEEGFVEGFRYGKRRKSLKIEPGFALIWEPKNNVLGQFFFFL